MKKMAMMMALAVGMAGCSGSGNGGATGAAPDRYMGERANVNGTYNGATSSTTMLEQRIKEDSARGATSGGGNTKY
jgi:ABC-type glycerol-3-phosphate transport system substrate-binding protein